MARLSESYSEGELDHLAVHGTLSVKANYVFDVTDYGAVGDDSTDDEAAFQAAIDAASAVGDGSTVLFPPGFYASTPFDLKSDIVISAYGATIRNIGDAVNSRLIVGTAVSNVKIFGLTIDGDKASFGDVTEQRHGIYLKACTDITLRDVRSFDNKGDGLYLGKDDTDTGTSAVRVYECDFDGNHRQGCSITTAHDVMFFGCKFRNTQGTAPAAGVDLEPNSTTDFVGGIGFHGCSFNGNAGGGLIVSYSAASTVTPKGPTVTGCNIYDNAGNGGVILSNAHGVRFVGCEIYDNDDEGIYAPNGGDDYMIVGGEIRGNGAAGISLAPTTGETISGFVASSVAIIDNGVDASPHAGISGAGAGSIDGFTVIGCRIGNVDTTGQDYGINLGNDRITNVIVVGNDLRNNVGNAYKQSDEAASRMAFANQGEDGPEITGARDTPEAALANLLAALEVAGIVLDSTTAS